MLDRMKVDWQETGGVLFLFAGLVVAGFGFVGWEWNSINARMDGDWELLNTMPTPDHLVAGETEVRFPRAGAYHFEYVGVATFDAGHKNITLVQHKTLGPGYVLTVTVAEPGSYVLAFTPQDTDVECLFGTAGYEPFPSKPAVRGSRYFSSIVVVAGLWALSSSLLFRKKSAADSAAAQYPDDFSESS
jgi:hypothetical protein